MNLIVDNVKFGKDGVKVEFYTYTKDGRDYKGWATLPAGDVNQYTPGDIYELTLTKVAEQAAVGA